MTQIAEKFISVAEVGQKLGISATTVRMHEQAGRIPPAFRLPTGQRIWPESAIDRLMTAEKRDRKEAAGVAA